MLGAALGRGQAERACLLPGSAYRSFVRFRTDLYANEQSEVSCEVLMLQVNQAVQLLTLISRWPRICRSA